MNKEAYEFVIAAQKSYLTDNEWTEIAENKFRVPHKYGVYAGDVYMLQRAFEFQMSQDVQSLKKV